MSIRWVASAAALIGALVIAATAAAAEPSRLVEAGARFPDRAYILSLPAGKKAAADAVRIRENGKPVNGASVTAAGAASQQQNFAVVLAIDASNSMRGKPIAAAVDAAKAFAAHRNPNQQMAIVYFDGTVRVAQPLTTSGARIASVLSHTPRLQERTRLYDAVDRSAQLLEAAGVKTGSVVVLSDGADVGSTMKLAQLEQNLQQQHVRAFTVGLASKALNAAALRRIASTSKGAYVSGSAEQLHAIYDRLGSKLSTEYLVRYRSLAGPGQKVDVEVSVAGVPGAFRAAYETPALAVGGPAAYHRSAMSQFLASGLSMVLVAALTLLLLGGAVFNVVRPRESGVQARVGSFVSTQRPKTQQSAILSEDLLRDADVSLARFSFWPRFRTAVEVGGIEMSPVHVVALTFLTSVLALFVLVLAAGPLFGVVGAIVVPFASYIYIRARADRVRREFGEQLPDNLEVMSAALRAGHSLVGALSSVAEGAVEPSRREFARIVADEQLGAPLEDAIGVVVERMENRDLDQVALIARLQRETGSSSAEVLDRVVETVRGRAELRRLVKTLTAQGRMSRWVLTFIPVVLALAISAISPGYLNPMFDHALGRVVLVLAGMMIVAGSLVIKRIVNIKV